MGISIIGAGYIVIYLGIITPILIIAAAMTAKTLTATIIAQELLWFLLKDIIAIAWFWVMSLIAAGLFAIGQE